ncbi:hypothetical protein Tco_1097786 [Tanacetum coccineum]
MLRRDRRVLVMVAELPSLRVADSHTGNHPEDDFTPLKTIRRPFSVIRKRILFELEWEIFEPEREVHICRLNPFGCAKLTTFVVMCKAYGCEPSVDLFLGFFNLCWVGKWLTFAKRSEKHVPNILPKVITRIEGWNERFFYVQDSIIPVKYSQLLSDQNKLDTKSFKDKLPPNIEEKPMFQRLGRYLTSVRIFPDPILFLAGLKSSWEHGQQRPVILVGGKVNTEPPKANKEPEIQPVDVKADSGGSPKPELPPVKKKLAPGSSTSRDTCAKTSSSKDDAPFLTVSDDDDGLLDVLELKDATVYHLKISAITPLAWKNHLDNHMDLELLDLHDRCYVRQVVVDNVVNRRSCELLQVIEKLRGEFDVMRSRERAREEECERLRVKCEAVMTKFEKNPDVVALREKISALSTEVKEHKLNLDRMMLESQKWAGYQQILSTLESKVTSLEAKKVRLEAVEVALQKEVKELKQDRREVVSKVVPYAAMELVYNDDIGSLVGKLVSSAIVYGRCRAFKQVADMKEPFDLSKVKDPSAPIKALLSNNPLTLQRPAPSRTQVPVPVSNLMSPPADASIVKP